MVGGVLLCALASVSLCVFESAYESWRARRFLETLSTLRPGTTTETDALNAMHRYGPGAESTRYGEKFVARMWDENSSSFLEANGRGYEFSNAGLQLLLLARKKAVGGMLYFRNGKLVLQFASQSEAGTLDCDVTVREAARDFTDLPEPSSGKAITVDERGSPVSLILVDVFPNATQFDKSKAYALNPSRLSSLSQCRRATDLIPQLSR
jgi:hypothetical protein